MSRAFLRHEADVDVDTHRDVEIEGGGADETDRDERTQRLSLSPSLSPSLSRDACNPYYEHPDAR
jgi:hypothetical protein